MQHWTKADGVEAGLRLFRDGGRRSGQTFEKIVPKKVSPKNDFFLQKSVFYKILSWWPQISSYLKHLDKQFEEKQIWKGSGYVAEKDYPTVSYGFLSTVWAGIWQAHSLR